MSSTANDSTGKKYRWFRYRLRSLLVLPVLFAACWWWVTLPERTAKQFVQLLATGDLPRAQAMIDGPQPSAGFWKIVESREFAFEAPSFQPATRGEYLSARRVFRFDWQRKILTGQLGPFVAHRNRIVLDPSAGNRKESFTDEVRPGNGEAILQKLLPLYSDRQKYEFEAGHGSTYILYRVPSPAHGEVRALTYLFDDELAAAASGPN